MKTKKTFNGPRSSFSLLPFDVQYRMITMVQDGATFPVLANDRIIADAYKSRGLRLVPQAITRLRRSPLYLDWTARRRKELADAANDRLTTAILRDTQTLDSVAEQTRVALLKAVSDLSVLSELPDEARVKALRSLTASVADLSNGDLRRKLADEKRARENAESAWKAREAELLAELAMAKETIKNLRAAVGAVDHTDVIGEMNQSVGIEK